jgi:hypothetical protein
MKKLQLSEPIKCVLVMFAAVAVIVLVTWLQGMGFDTGFGPLK